MIRWCSSSPSGCTTDPSTAIRASRLFPGAPIPKGQVEEGYYKVPLGKADIVRAGADVTVITYGTMVFVAAAAAAAMNLDAEIIDLRSLVPLDVDTICSSVRKTGRCVVAHEATRFGGIRRRSICPSSKRNASGTWRRRYSASPAGIRPTRMPLNGSIFPVRRASRWRSRPSWSRHEPVRIQDAGLGRGHGGCGDRRLAYQTGRCRGRRSTHRRGDDRQSGGGSAGARERPSRFDHRRAGRQGGGRFAAHRVRGGRGGRAAAAAQPPRRRRQPPSLSQPPSHSRARAAAVRGATPAAEALPAAAALRPPHRARQGRVMASPANRRRAREAGIDLATVVGSGPGGRICATTWPQPPPGVRPRPRAGEPSFRGNVGNQGHRLAPLDRRTHERGQAQHSALRVCRRSRCH